MKKIMIILFLGMAIISCTKEEITNQGATPSLEKAMNLDRQKFPCVVVINGVSFPGKVCNLGDAKDCTVAHGFCIKDK